MSRSSSSAGQAIWLPTVPEKIIAAIIRKAAESYLSEQNRKAPGYQKQTDQHLTGGNIPFETVFQNEKQTGGYQENTPKG
jgi:hypothetical protein